MFAVIKSGGRQYKVAVGETLEVNRLPVEVGQQVRFEEVLLISDAERTQIGSPLIEDAVVLATATTQGRGPKLIVFKYKAKKRYRHKRGHRQELTFLTVDDIVANGKSLVTGSEPVLRIGSASPEIGEQEAPEVVEVSESPIEAASTPEVADETPKAEPEKKTRRRRAAKAEEAPAPEKSEE